MSEEKFRTRYNKLNLAQKKAVDSIEGPVLVVAGPGSGKTEILGLRVANILRETDAGPGDILCLTFTDAAAVNMRTRLEGLIGPAAYRVAIHTFHSFCVDIIGRYPEYFYDGASFSPADTLVQIEIIEELLRETSHDNPLRKEHPEQGYVYLSSALSAIGQLKKAGLTPAEFEQILQHNKLVFQWINSYMHELFGGTLSAKSLPAVAEFLERMHDHKSHKETKFPVVHMRPLSATVFESLRRAYDESVELGKTAPLSAWKAKYLVKDEEGMRVLKETISHDKLLALAGLYDAYKSRMHERGYFDFDDMLIDAIQAIEHRKVLRYDLQERYQYVLVDEFQDTNDAQMRLLRLLTDAPSNEGHPNIMAVGDDDQAIYKFQGALISNILGFKDSYTRPTIVTLTHNYRSTQDILDVAGHIIGAGVERLENLIPDMEKKLVAANESLVGGAIVNRTLPTSAHEYYFIAHEIRKLIDAGTNPKDIAVIARRHRDLEDLVPYLHKRKVPVSYERQQNVIIEPHVHQLITIARFISTLMRKDRERADWYLPEILSYPFWQIDRMTLWNISLTADKEHMTWLNVMLSHEDQKISGMARFFQDLARESLHEPLEYILDDMVGAHLELATESEDEDAPAVPRHRGKKEPFKSPFREFYFGRATFVADKLQYLTFLSSLRVFVLALREYKHGEQLKIDDLVAFVDMHEKNNLLVADTSPFVNAREAVSLLSAHKAKGLEFDTVFVMSCLDEVWAPKRRGSNITMPMNLPITPAGDTVDDQLKLFYVALTRAKRHLYLTSYDYTDSGKELLRLQFLLAPEDGDAAQSEISQRVRRLLDLYQGDSVELDVADVLTTSWQSFNEPPFVHDEQALLGTLVENYQMSVTHLNNYLDVSRGGPQVFLEQNLLRFPQAKTLSGSFGSAMHKAVEMLYTHFRMNDERPSRAEFLKWFEIALRKERLSETDFTVMLERGREALTMYYDLNKKDFDPSHKIEVNFKNQGVLQGKAHLSGKIDKMITVGNTVSVHDFKTGAVEASWEGKTPYEKIKLYKYRRQLAFYKLLVEQSREYAGYHVTTGVLEFLEPKEGMPAKLPLEMDEALVERTRRLVEVVYQKIASLDFPSIEKYSADIDGIIAFENDLLDEAANTETKDN